jgi:F420-dependent methylenetetrahydromethanopterin dehydrogenase
MAKLKILAEAKVAGNLTNLLGINIKERRDRKSIKALRVMFSQWRYQPQIVNHVLSQQYELMLHDFVHLLQISVLLKIGISKA